MDDADGVLPTFFISHGGGPWPWIKHLLPGDWRALEYSLQRLPSEIGTKPKAILAISGHWVAEAATVMVSDSPPMYYDYLGFPDFTYGIKYRAPGSPEAARRVIQCLSKAGIEVKTDSVRGFDHGVFVPFAVAYPNADVPILQLSLEAGYNPESHLKIGRALAPLRREGVAIIASGSTYHNLRELGPSGEAPSREFEAWLTETLCRTDPEERIARLLDWENAPSARISHPEPDHFIPLLVALGAAETAPATRIYYEATFMGAITSSSYRFGSLHQAKVAPQI